MVFVTDNFELSPVFTRVRGWIATPCPSSLFSSPPSAVIAFTIITGFDSSPAGTLTYATDPALTEAADPTPPIRATVLPVAVDTVATANMVAAMDQALTGPMGATALMRRKMTRFTPQV